MSTELHLTLPQIDVALDEMNAGEEASRLFALQKLAGYAKSQPLPANSLRELAAFIFELSDSGKLPIAALSRLADSGHWDASWWLRLDPVHFRPDRDDLLLFGPENLSLTTEEGAALAVSVRDYLAEEGYMLEIGDPQRWYLRFDTPPDCRFTDLQTVNGLPIGQNSDQYMPTGKDAPIYKSLLNQLQMLLHVHPLNKMRAEQGKPTANGVWFWGGGAFDELNPRQWDAVLADAPLFRGLALLAGNEPLAVPDNFNSWFATQPQGQQLVVLPPADFHDLETGWFEPSLSALREKLLDTLIIHLPASKRSLFLTPGKLKRFWRRPLSLSKLFPAPDSAMERP